MREVLYLLEWIDGLEIGIVAFGIYYVLRWLALSNTSLLEITYGYSLLLVFSYWTNLYALKDLLLVLLPVMMILVLIFHHHMLQRNFVTRLAPAPSALSVAENWIDLLVRALFVHAAEHNRVCVSIIEFKDSLHEVLQASFFLHVPCSYDLLVALQKTCTKKNAYVWVKKSGLVIAIDASLKETHTVEAADTKNTLPLWQQDALLITANTDAVVVAVHPVTRKCTLIYEGKSIHEVSVATALRFIRQKIDLTLKKGPLHEQNSPYHSL